MGRKERYRFDEDILIEMNKFEKDFLLNKYRKDTSENQGPNYKEKIAAEDKDVFFAYLDSDYAEDFLNLK